MIWKKPPSPTSQEDSEPGFIFGSLRLQPDGTLLRGECTIHLPPKELMALKLLLHHAGQIVTTEQLKEALWGCVHVTADSVPKCMSSLRALLEPEKCIETFYKRGYLLKAKVERYAASGTQSLPRLAIMPFVAGAYVADYLGPAIAEETTTRLTGTSSPKVSVLARDSVFTLARQGLTAQQVGEALKADLVLTGTLLALPTHLRLRAEMIDVQEGTQTWVEDILAPRDRVARMESELVDRLTFRLGGGPYLSGTEITFDDSMAPGKNNAYEIFLRGRYEWQSLEPHRMQDGMRQLHLAADLDPSLIAAQVELVNACVSQAFCGFAPAREVADEIRRVAQNIPNILKNAPALLPSMGWVSFHVERDLAAAIKAFSVPDHLPHDPRTTRLRVTFALSRQRFEEADQILRAALIEDPFAPWLHARLAWASHLAGKPRESVEQIEKALQLFPDHNGICLYGALILAHNGHAKRGTLLARELLKRSPYFDIATAILAYTTACEGRGQDAEAILEQLQWLSRERFVISSFNPAIHVVLGNIEDAISELRTADEARCPWFFQMLADPRLNALHGHPEFESMLATLEQMESLAAVTPEHR